MSATVETRDLPQLRRGVTVLEQSGQVSLRRLREDVLLEGVAADLFRRMQAHLDGRTALGEIAQRLGESAPRLQAFAERLNESGVLTFRSASAEGKRITGLEFHALHHEHCLAWLEPVYGHPLWEKMVSGRASRAQVLGFAFEKYHYIEAAFEHMGLAAANASPEMMPHLARHFIEEYTHGDIYRKGLRSLFADQEILQAQPLPSTRALINYLCESARRNSFSYYAGNELLQLTENTGDSESAGAVDSFYAAMRSHYPYTERLVDSFIAHTRADQHLGHADAFLEMCRSVPPLSPAEVNDALNVARNMAEHLVLFMDGIETFYGSFDTVPRRPCDLLSE